MTNLEAANLLDNLIGMVSDNHDSDYDEALSKGRDILKLLDKNESKAGRWEEYGHNISDSYIWDGVRCSVCKKDAQKKTRFIKRDPVIWDRDCFKLTNYCPNCGAKMIEENASTMEQDYTNYILDREMESEG